jgi:hypothetical protein
VIFAGHNVLAEVIAEVLGSGEIAGAGGVLDAGDNVCSNKECVAKAYAEAVRQMTGASIDQAIGGNVGATRRVAPTEN